MLKHEIIHNKIFDLVARRVDVIKGSHTHLLIIVDRSHKIICPEKFDQYISAKIPSTENPYLCVAVLCHMIYGSCGPSHLKCPCMK
ncbi:hypothetical protein V2J09_017890 [Rumex salicifolius]